jgi:hypothetical protein
MTEWKLADVSTVIVGAGFSAAATDGRMPRAVTALVIGNIGKQRDAAAGGPGADGRATGGCCDAHHKPRSHDTSRIAWGELVQVHDDRDIFQRRIDELPAIDIHSL